MATKTSWARSKNHPVIDGTAKKKKNLWKRMPSSCQVVEQRISSKNDDEDDADADDDDVVRLASNGAALLFINLADSWLGLHCCGTCGKCKAEWLNNSLL